MKKFIYYSKSVEQIVKNWSLDKPGIEYENEFLTSLITSVKNKSNNYYEVVPRVTIIGLNENDSFNFYISRCSEKDNYDKKLGIGLCNYKVKRKEYYRSVSINEIPTKKQTEWFIQQCKNIEQIVLLNSRKINEKF